MSLPTLNTFVIGCIGATAPEIVRLYNLRSEPRFQWSWGYVLYSIPFILLGGFIAWILEPSSKYAAFYAGISTPVLVTAVAKNSSLGTSSSQPEKPFPGSESPPQLPSPPVAPNPSASSVEEQAKQEQVRRSSGKAQRIEQEQYQRADRSSVEEQRREEQAKQEQVHRSSVEEQRREQRTHLSARRTRNPISFKSFLKALY